MARFCASRAVETPRGYEIHHVIGPDEIHEDVDNSAYTNVMAAWALRRAAQLVEAGVDGGPRRLRCRGRRRWRDVAERMVVLRTPEGLLEQHEGFMALPAVGRGPEGRAELAWQRDRQSVARREAGRRGDADGASLPADYPRRTCSGHHYELYEPLTLHLSSLSEAVHSLVARRVGLENEADRYLERAVGIDLEDNRGNRADGLHMATQGGVWQAVVMGRRRRGRGRRPAPPGAAAWPHWERLRFRWIHRGTLLTVTVSADELTVEAAEGAAAITAPGWTGEVRAGEPLRLSRSAGGWRAAA